MNRYGVSAWIVPLLIAIRDVVMKCTPWKEVVDYE